jgi:hypothetical protein
MTTTFNATIDQLINGALRMIGVVAQGETATATQLTEAAEALNMMVKALEADGMPLWGLVEYSMTMTASQTKYQLGTTKPIAIAKPLKIIQAWNRTTSSGVDVPMRILTKQEYNMLGNKTSKGSPIQLYYNPLLDYGELQLFPTPDATTATNNTIYLVYQRPFNDVATGSGYTDFPQEWLEALKYGLAVRLAPEYGVDADSRKFLLQEYQAAKTMALSFGTEEGSIYFQRDSRSW